MAGSVFRDYVAMWVLFAAVVVATCWAQIAYVVDETTYVVAVTPDVFYVAGGVPVRVVNASTPVLTCGSVVWMDYGLSGMWTPVATLGSTEISVGIYVNVVSCGAGVLNTQTMSRMTRSVAAPYADVAVRDGMCAAPYTVLTAAPVLLGVQMVAVGNAHACALLGDGSVYCWGSNARCQFGTGLAAGNRVYTAVRYTWFADFEYLTANGDVTCGIRANVTGLNVVCWGMLGPTGPAPVGTNCSTYGVARYGYYVTDFAAGVEITVAITRASIAVSVLSADYETMYWYMTTVDRTFLPSAVMPATLVDYGVSLGIANTWSQYPTLVIVCPETDPALGDTSVSSVVLMSGDAGFGVMWIATFWFSSTPGASCGTAAGIPYARGYFGADAARVCAGVKTIYNVTSVPNARMCIMKLCSSVLSAGAPFAPLIPLAVGLSVLHADMYVTSGRALMRNIWVGAVANATDFTEPLGNTTGPTGTYTATAFASLTRGAAGVCGATVSSEATLLGEYACVRNNTVVVYEPSVWTSVVAGMGGVCGVTTGVGAVVCNGTLGVPGLPIAQTQKPVRAAVRATTAMTTFNVDACNVTVVDAVCYGRVRVVDGRGIVVMNTSVASMPRAYTVGCNGTSYCVTLGGCAGGDWRVVQQSFTLGTVTSVAAGTAHTCVSLADTSVWCVGNIAQCAYVLVPNKAYDTTQWNQVVAQGAAAVYGAGSMSCMLATNRSLLWCTGTAQSWHWCTRRGMVLAMDAPVVSVVMGVQTICVVVLNVGYRVVCYGLNMNNYMGTNTSRLSAASGYVLVNGGVLNLSSLPQIDIADRVLANATVRFWVGNDVYINGVLQLDEHVNTTDLEILPGLDLDRSFGNIEGHCLSFNVSGPVYRAACFSGLGGDNLFGQNGYVDTLSAAEDVWFLVDGPVPVQGGAVGAGHVVLWTTDNGLYCAGDNAFGQCGHRYRNVTSPVVYVPMEWWLWPYMPVTSAPTSTTPTLVDTDDSVDMDVDGIGRPRFTSSTGWLVGGVFLGLAMSISVVVGYASVVWLVRRLRLSWHA